MRISDRKLINSLLILTALLVTSSCIYAGTGVLPVGQAEYEFIYDRLERSISSVPLDSASLQIGPYLFADLPESLGPLKPICTAEKTRIALFGCYREELLSARHARGQAYESIRGGFAGQPLPNLFVYANFALDEHRAKDPNYSGKKWRGLAGDVEQAFAHFQSGKFRLTAGRFASFWGIRRSLLLGSNAILDGVSYSLRWGRLTLSYQLSSLDGLSPEHSGTSSFENRYLAGHRFDLHFSRKLRIGLSEMVVFGGPGRQLEFAYLNPILFYHSSQLNGKADDNTLMGMDFDLIPSSRVHCYGQLLVDDFQIEKKTQSDQEPDEYGLLVGTYVTDIIRTWDVRTEYSRITNWTYNQVLPRNRYLFNGKPISAALGNDYDLLNLSLIHWFGDLLSSTLHLGYYRQGEGSPNAVWTEPWMTVSGDYSEPFPTGIVQRTASASLEMKGFIKGPLFIDAEAGLQRVTNFGHIRGNDRTIPFISLLLSALFSASPDIR